jgi:assimilatory nitrate reductase electron transfer subunit
LAVSGGVLVDEQLRSWTDNDIYAIGDCAHVEPRPADGDESPVPAGGPTGLIGAGWRQADWLAARFTSETGASVFEASAGFSDTHAGVVMLKAEGIDVASAGNVKQELWDEQPGFEAEHGDNCQFAPLHVSQWADPEHGRYVKLVSRAGILEGFVAVGMPRTAAELTLLFERGSELPADRSVLLRYDGPDYEPAGNSDAFAPEATVCWCNGVTVGAIEAAAEAGNDTVPCIGTATRAGTGCGGCKGRIGEVLERAATSGPQELVG